MSSKKSFVLYTESKSLFELLSDEQAGRLIKYIFAYEAGEGTESIAIDGMTQMAFAAIRNYLDRNATKYEQTCERRREAGRKGGLKKAENQAKEQLEEKPKEEKPKEEKPKEENPKEEKPKEGKTAKEKPKKSKYGEYKNVALTDKELETLNQEYGYMETERAIQYLDEYVEMKGAKYKSHYLALRKWVYKALKERGKSPAGYDWDSL